MAGRRSDPGGRTVAQAMLSIPWTHSPVATVAEVAEFFADEHVHAALIINAAGYLIAVVERADIAVGAAPDVPAVRLGQLDGRTVQASTALAEAHEAMLAARRRRAAVISPNGRLLGLLCLKASGTGFCSDQDVLERGQESGPGSLNRAGRVR